MPPVDLTLEIPEGDHADAAFPDPKALAWKGVVGSVAGLDGDRVTQLAVVVTAGSVRVLRTWLLARADRLKRTRVVWNGREFHAYSAREIALLLESLEAEVSDDAPPGG